MKKNARRFLRIPEFPGGKEALKKYILENLKYPEGAINQRIEGIVYLVADINDNGIVENVNVEKGIGYGCDEEAIRLVKGFHFGSVKNKGIRLHTKKRFRINFKLPPSQKINYNLVKKELDKDQNSSPVHYLYTIKFKK